MRGIGAAMDHFQDVAYRVVLVALSVVAHRVAVTGMRQIHPERIIVVRLPGWVRPSVGTLTEMFTSSRGDEPVDRVVGVLSAGLYSAVLEVDGLLRVIANCGDVADRIEGVAQILKTIGVLGVRSTSSHEVDQPESQPVVA